MSQAECPFGRIVIDWLGRVMTYRKDDASVISVRFDQPKHNSADLFYYCCAIAIAQAHHLGGTNRTTWRGADSTFLDLVAKEFRWKLAENSRETYWVTLTKGKRVDQVAAHIFVEDSTGTHPHVEAVELFGRIQGYVLGTAKDLGDGSHELWIVEFTNRGKTFAPFRNRIVPFLPPLPEKGGATCVESGEAMESDGPYGCACVTASTRLMPPGNIPPPPGVFVGRSEVLAELKLRLGICAQVDGNRGNPKLIVMRGLPGIGKSTTAIAVAYESEIIRSFTDGILWTSLGQEPELVSELANWGRLVGNDSILTAGNTKLASARLSESLRTKRMLLIVDDIWQAEHAEVFRVGGPYCATLLTTRLPGVAQRIAPFAGSVYVLPLLDEQSSFDLVKCLAPEVVREHPEEIRQLVQALEGLPLALKVAGHLLNSERAMGWGVGDLLYEVCDEARILATEAPSDCVDLVSQTTPTVAALLRKSTDKLHSETRECFAMLGPFAPKPATFDIEALGEVWQVHDPRPITRELVARGLLEPTGDSTFQMHALLVSHAKALLKAQ